MLTINSGDIVLEEKTKNHTNITNVAEKELTLLGRHIDVLKTVIDQGPIGIIRLSKLTGHPQHMIRYSLRTLENDGLIKPSIHGAVVTNKVHDTLGTLESTLDDLSTMTKELKKRLK